MRACTKCGKDKTETSFYARRPECKRCAGPGNRTNCKTWRRKIHDAALDTLGAKCTCCGETRRTMLDIDHVLNDGRQDVAKLNGNNFKVYQEIRDGLRPGRHRILCCNCNQSKRRNGGFCQHFTDRWGPWFASDDAPIPEPYSA